MEYFITNDSTAAILDNLLVHCQFKHLRHVRFRHVSSSPSATLKFFRSHPTIETLATDSAFGRGGEQDGAVKIEMEEKAAVPLLPHIRKLALPEFWIAGILYSHGSGDFPPIEDIRSLFRLRGPFFSPPIFFAGLPHLRRIHYSGGRDIQESLEILAQHSPQLQWIQSYAYDTGVFGDLLDAGWDPTTPGKYLSQWVRVAGDFSRRVPLRLTNQL